MSFVVLNYNGGETVLACLESVRRQSIASVECIVVDNGSTDDSLTEIRERFPELRVVSNGSNLGFPGGMNAGFRHAQGKLIVALNQDAVVASDFSEVAVAAFARCTGIGAVGGPVYKLDGSGPSTEFDAGGYWLRRRIAVGPIGPTNVLISGVFGVSGCCPVFRREMLEDLSESGVEAFDESFFLYFEDIDLFFRACLRGWRVDYHPDLIAWHHRSWSSGGGRRFYQKPMWVQRLHLRNRYVTFLKNCPLFLMPELGFGLIVADVALVPFLLIKSPTSLAAVAGAWWDVLKLLSDILRRRRRVQLARTRPLAEIRHFVQGW